MRGRRTALAKTALRPPPGARRRRRAARLCVRAAAILAALAAAALLQARSGSAEPAGGGEHFFRSLNGVHVAGYQGWFDCPGDGASLGWSHWLRGDKPQDPDALAVDMWPDTSELSPDERCPTGLRLASGAAASLFSDQNAKTVARHFRWMRQYGIDGAAMQRFTVAVADPTMRAHFDAVLRHAMAAAEANRRGFFVMYDISGMDGAAALRQIEQDWPRLTEELRVVDSPAYLFHRGKPVVGVWGFGFTDRNVSPEEASAIIRYLKTAPVAAAVLGGVPASWRNLGSDGRWPDSRKDLGWPAVYRSFDVISPWSVGRFGDDRGADDFAHFRLVPDIMETRRLGIGYTPVVFPGFSWHNGAGRETHSPLNVIPRRCGAFYRHQIDNAVASGATTLYTAMFDEVNEGTAVFKLAVNAAQQPAGAELVTLDADGCRSATSDMYLRAAGEASRRLAGRR